MYENIIRCLEQQLTYTELEKIKKHNIHLGIFTEPYLTYMLDGKKTIESRFSKNRILIYNQISKEYVVIVKQSSGNVLAYFTIKEVLFFDLCKVSIDEIKFKNYKQLCADDNFWIIKKNSKQH